MDPNFDKPKPEVPPATPKWNPVPAPDKPRTPPAPDKQVPKEPVPEKQKV